MTTAPRVAIWLGGAPPLRSRRWLDGALAAAARLSGATAVAAGAPAWLDLAADRASRAGLPAIGVATDLALDYLGWAQIMAAAARQLGATTILVDEASRPERFAEVGAIAELCESAQLTHVVAIAPEADALRASRVSGRTLQTVRITGPAVIGLRIAGPPGDAPPARTPPPSPAASPSPPMRRCDLASLGLDPGVLGHRATPPQAHGEPRRTAERTSERITERTIERTGERTAERTSERTAERTSERTTERTIDRVAEHLAGYLALRAPAATREDRPGKETRSKGSRSAKGARGTKGE